MSTIVRFTIDGDEERSYTLVDAPNPPVTGDRVEHGGTTYMVDSSIMSTLAGQDPMWDVRMTTTGAEPDPGADPI